MSKLKTITYTEFIKLKPCWLETKEGNTKLKRIAKQRENWSAVDILNLDKVSYNDRIWAVTKADLISKRVLVLWSCECAEYALSLVKHPDERSVKAIKAARLYLDGKITLEELTAARAAWAAWAAAWAAASAAASEAAWAASEAAWAAAAWAASEAAWAAWAASEAAWAAEAKTRFIASLIKLIQDNDKPPQEIKWEELK